MNGFVLAGVAFTLWCLWLWKAAWAQHATAKASRNWPCTQGQMTAVELWGKRNIEGSMQDAERLAVRYVYTVDGREYESRAVAFFTLVYPETLHFARQHPTGSDVTVWFDPRNPVDSVLIPGLNPAKPYSDLVLAGFGVVLGIAVSAGIYTGWIG